MRALLLLSAALLSGCKAAEVALIHPTTGVHIVARVEAKDASTAQEILPSP